MESHAVMLLPLHHSIFMASHCKKDPFIQICTNTVFQSGFHSNVIRSLESLFFGGVLPAWQCICARKNVRIARIIAFRHLCSDHRI